MPYKDRIKKGCAEGMYIRLKDDYEDYGLYEIEKIEDKLSDKSESLVTCSHVLSTLLVKNLKGQTQVGGLFSSDPKVFNTRDVLEFILNKQEIKYWQLGDCDFNFEYEYLFEESTLLSAIFATVAPIVAPSHWVWDTTTQPWTLHLKKLEPNTAEKCRFIYGKNIKDISRVTDISNLFTRIVPLGFGEGINQLNITKINNGLDYLEAPQSIINKYKVREAIWIDRGIQNAQVLMESAQKLLELGQVPRETISFSAIDLSLLTREKIDRPQIGKYARIIHPAGNIDQQHFITEISRSNIEAQSGELNITLANTSEDIIKTLSSIQNKLFIEQSCAQGSTFFWQIEKSENIDAVHPLRFQIYIPPQARNINSVNLRFFFEAFRADVQAVASVQSTIATTSNAPASNQTSLAGGETNSSTSAGGGEYGTSGASSSSSAGGGIFTTTYQPFNTGDVVSGNAGAYNHTHDVRQIVQYTDNLISTHTHNIQHNHGLNIPSHTHGFIVRAHTHIVTIPAHQHTVLIQAHTHAMQYGIFEGSKASSAILRIGSNKISIPQNTDLDIVNYMEKNTDGALKRGTHIIEIIPNTLTRITATISPQVFSQSRSGGVY